jgi:F0F1-type ATP synthase assembly protein I
MSAGDGIGQIMGASVFVGVGLGWLLEKLFPSISPWGIAGGVLLGAATGFWEMFRAEKAREADSKKSKP